MLAKILKSVVSKGNIKACYQDWKVINAILKCRTASLGGHLYKCLGCGHSKPSYNSCRNRHCPKCQGKEIANWLKQREQELLEVPYFHTVFTLPHELNPVFLQNKKVLYNFLFQAVAETIKKATNSKYKGEAGFFSIFHTWGQKLDFHPHIHCVIPGVILKKDNTVIKTSNNYFLPDRVLEKLFCGIFLDKLEKLHGKLSFYNEYKHLNDKQEFKKLLIKSTKHNWVVYSKKPFASSNAVLKYLSRYTHRIAINNSRIRDYSNSTVTFNYKDYKNGAKKRTCKLKEQEFIRRFLLHTLPHQFVRIRHYGFLGSRNKKKALSTIREHLNTKIILKKSLVKESSVICPKCKDAKMIKVTEIQMVNQKLSSFLLREEVNRIIPHRAPPDCGVQQRMKRYL
ncbi:UNVERIFIED_CONTAM: hypothetical protein GTU68_031245 [Idotea baltica]|nr:hypothetical protein [Idotea baltica]